MYNEFICPDGEKVLITECLEKCRMCNQFPLGRCLSKRTLTKIAEQREWTGVPSTTQLLNGTREEYLKLTKEFAINPQQRIFALFGTGVHSALEDTDIDEGISECRINDGTSSGCFDHYYDGVLYDIKTYGSYSVIKTLGMKPRYVFDGYYSRGANKGKAKFKVVYEPTGAKIRLPLSLQLNDYRCKLELLGFPVHKMCAEIIVRDAGTKIAKERGITQNAMLVEVNKISDHWIKLYMKTKKDRLLSALETNIMPPPCSHRESWGGRKCQSYCDVWEYCDKGRCKHV